MKLIQVNIWNGRLIRQLIKLLELEQPDIICMQEVFHGPNEIVMLEQTFNNIRTVQAATGLEHAFFSPAVGMTFGGKSVDMGNAILSKFPLQDQKTIFTAGAYEKNIDVTQKSPNIRNLQVARIELGDKSITIANHHGYWLSQPLGDDTTTKTFQVVANTLESINGPIILAGDLNVIPEAPAMRVFDNLLEDLTATYSLKTTLSELGKVPNVACDHMLVSKEIKVIDYRTSDVLVSDHKAVILEFEL